LALAPTDAASSPPSQTFRRIKGTVAAPGRVACRKGNPCTVNFVRRHALSLLSLSGALDARPTDAASSPPSQEDVELAIIGGKVSPWLCGNAKVELKGKVLPAFPTCQVGPKDVDTE